MYRTLENDFFREYIYMRFTRLLFAIIIGLGLFIRLNYITDQSRNNPLFYHPIMDAKIHTELALNFFEGHPLSKPPFFRAPLYP
ncbi:MAG: hypothetical protein AB1765_09790, partial [Candidatus Hydrogenedentota bacterium]